MNNRYTKIFIILASSSLFATACSEDNSTFETPGAPGDITNPGTISQKHLSILAEDTHPEIFDQETGSSTDTALTFTVKIGGHDGDQLLTDGHTIFFATEWGAFRETSCITKNRSCTVTLETSFSPTSPPPLNRLVTITAYTIGEEHYSDTNRNGVFDDNDQPFFATATLFHDRVEPFVDANRNGIFDGSDTIIDVISGNVLGRNGVHDFNDGLLNSPNCRHSSLCSTVSPTTYIWADTQIDMNGPPAAP